jgi:hypothetical protein
MKDFIIRGLFQDGITAQLGRVNAAFAATAKAAAAANKAMAAGALNSAHLKNLTMTTRAMKAQQAALVGMTRSQAAYNKVAAGGAMGGFFGVRGRGGGKAPPKGFMARHWGQYQMGLAALGQKGYALGRGGPSTLVGLGSLYGIYKATRAYGDMEKAMAGVRRAIDTEKTPFSKEQAKKLGRDLEEIGIPLSMSGTTVAAIAEKLALGGITNPDALRMLTKTTAQGASIWEGVDADMVGDNIAKMLSLYQKGVEDPNQLNAAARKFIATTDYFADSTPGVDAKNLVTAFERSMASGKALGITPESLMAVTAGWLQNAEKSGERIGTRQRTGFMDMMGWLVGNDDVTGKNRAQLGEVVGGPAGKLIKDAAIKDPMLGLAMFVTEMKKKGLKVADQQIRRVFKDERGGYLMPLVSGAEDVVDKLMVTEASVREWALKEADELERTAKAGKAGRAQRAEAWKLRQQVKKAEKAVAENRIEQQVGIALDTMNDAFTRLGLRIAKIAKGLAAATVVSPLTDAANAVEGWLGQPYTDASVRPHPSLPKGRAMPKVATGRRLVKVPGYGIPVGFGNYIPIPQYLDLPPADEVPVTTVGEDDSGGYSGPTRRPRIPRRDRPFNRDSSITGWNAPPNINNPRSNDSVNRAVMNNVLRGLAEMGGNVVGFAGRSAAGLTTPQWWGERPPVIGGGPQAPMVTPGPPATVTVPFTASAGPTPGHVEVSVKVTQQPNVVVQGAGGTPGMTGDTPSGAVTVPGK